MQEIVTANHCRIRIRKQRKSVVHFLTLPLVDFGRIDADGDDANPALIEIGKPLLETPQLGVAEQSPEPAIEDKKYCAWFSIWRLGRNQIGECGWFVVLVRQTKIGRFLANTRGAFRSRQLL